MREVSSKEKEMSATYPIAVGRVAKSQYDKSKGQVHLRELDAYLSLLLRLWPTMRLHTWIWLLVTGYWDYGWHSNYGRRSLDYGIGDLDSFT